MAPGSRRGRWPLLAALAVVAAGCGWANTLRVATTGASHLLLLDDPARLTAPHGIRGVRVNGPIAWIVPVDRGVVLIDAGVDERAVALRAALAGTELRAILLTHGHPDHAAGAAALGDMPVYVGRGDLPLVDGERFRRALPIEALGRAMGFPTPQRLIAVDAGALVEIGGARFAAVTAPGHTPGCIAWRYRDVLFSGDAAISIHGGRIQTAYPIFSDDAELARQSMRRLRRIDLRYLCDGHYGCIARAPRRPLPIAGW